MKRKEFLYTFGAGVIGAGLLNPQALGRMVESMGSEQAKDETAGKLMPALFLAHGSPENALADNDFTRSLKTLGRELPKPKVIVVVSAHWLTRGTMVTAMPNPKTIHDFGGFGKELFAVQYKSPGAPEFARTVKETVTSTKIEEDSRWGLDHGAWSVLLHLYPEADVPVIQLSIDYRQPPEYHYKLAQELQSLRSKGALILGSGNITHNFSQMDWNTNAQPFGWTEEFDALVKTYIDKGDHQPLVHYDKLKHHDLAIPTNDHYLPLLYALGLQQGKDTISYPHEGFQNAGFSMRCVKVG